MKIFTAKGTYIKNVPKVYEPIKEPITNLINDSQN